MRAPVTISSADRTTPVNLLGELFVPDGTLYVADIGDFSGTKGRVLEVNPWTGSVRTLATGLAAPNAFAMDARGRLFVSDSFTGAIYTIDTEEGGKTLWKQDVLLTTQGQPPFGANGIAFDRAGRFLYVANTGDSRVLRIAVNGDGDAGAVTVFAAGASINAAQGTTPALRGADGIAFDERGNLWVCANQANEIQVLSPRGKLKARYTGRGADAMDFPASLVFFGRSLRHEPRPGSPGHRQGLGARHVGRRCAACPGRGRRRGRLGEVTARGGGSRGSPPSPGNPPRCIAQSLA